jgi:F-type H+-transporting ATPase subunit a
LKHEVRAYTGKTHWFLGLILMRTLKSILAAVALLALPLFGLAAESAVPAGIGEAGHAATNVVGEAGHAAGEAGHDAAGHAGEHHGLPSYAVKVFHIGPLPVTNSMIVTILVAIGIVVFAQLACRDVKRIPSGLQNFAEWMVESMYNFLGHILGAELIKKSFWFFGTLFFFILFTNWFGLVPGVGTFGWGYYDAANHFHLKEPWLRGGNADLNMVSAMALLFFVLWTVWAVQANGVGGVFAHIFAPKGKSEGFMRVFMMVIFLIVGVLEAVSIAFRPVSLSFRLYGNVFAGENMLESMMNLIPGLSWIIPLPFYFLELLVGLVQALVFTLLTAVFTLLICEHEHEEGHAHGAEEHAHH